MSGQYMSIWGDMKKILTLLREGRNVVIEAPTGSGKTTQVPQAILDSGLAGKGTIFVVEPRRIACRAAARFVAAERETRLGMDIGYAVRYDRQFMRFVTKICFVTDGVLLRLIERNFDSYDARVVVFDEFHERRINSDIGLALVKARQKRQSDLRIVVMSATLKTEALAHYLNAAVVKSTCLSFPVLTSYVDAEPLEREVPQMAAQKIVEYHASGKPGHILVFLPGKGAIFATAKLLEEAVPEDVIILPLYGELTLDEQDRIFQDTDKRKVILATNIAESSLTIPGVRIVIDSGLERRNIYDPFNDVSTLAVTKISKMSADQRTGRAGRDSLGYCLRLWSREEDEKREFHRPAEIQRGDIGQMVLSLRAAGVKDIEQFDFFERPDFARVRAVTKTLRTLGALDKTGHLTHMGQTMLRLPLPPRYGRMIVEAERNGTLKEVSIIVAMMSKGGVFSYPREYSQEEIDAQHKIWANNPASDCFTLLNIFTEAKKSRFNMEWFQENFVSYDAVIEARLMRWDILRSLYNSGVSLKNLVPFWQRREMNTNELIRRAIISGLIDQVAVRKHGRQYKTAAGLTLLLPRNSAVESDFIAVAGLVKLSDDSTTRIVYATVVDEEMLKQLAPQFFRVERRVVKRFPATKIVQIEERLCYLNLVLRSRTGLMSETAEALPQKLAPLTAIVSQLNKAVKEEV